MVSREDLRRRNDLVSRESMRSEAGSELERALCIQREHSDSMLRSSVSVKSEIVKSAEDKREGLSCLKTRISEELEEVETKLSNIK